MADGLPNLITSLVGLLSVTGAAVAWWVKRRDTRQPSISRKAVDIAAINEAVGGALDIVQRNLTDEIERLRRDNKAMADEMSVLRAETRDCDERLSVLEDNETYLIRWVTRLHLGIEDGTIPPLPPIPPEVIAILDPPFDMRRRRK